jgi:hypothetical protein
MNRHTCDNWHRFPMAGVHHLVARSIGTVAIRQCNDCLAIRVTFTPDGLPPVVTIVEADGQQKRSR